MDDGEMRERMGALTAKMEAVEKSVERLYTTQQDMLAQMNKWKAVVPILLFVGAFVSSIVLQWSKIKALFIT